MSGYDNIDPESRMNFEFSDASIRQGFIRKVYGILMVQLLVTTGFIALFLFYEPIGLWTRTNPGFFYAVLILSLVMMIALTCCEAVRRNSPTNMICLMIFTAAEGFLLGTATSTFRADSVLFAIGITTVICLALTLFSFQTKIDFTGMGTYLFVAVIVLFIFGIVAMFLPILTTVYSCLGALLFSFYLVFDTQMLMGGKHKYAISPEEYIFATLSIYLDIINIFLFILQIIDSARN
jgi:FtsH-binding integral membrane protein